MTRLKSYYFHTSDQVKLHYLQGGAGRTVIMIPGGGFSVDVFKAQFTPLSQMFNLIALDQRGHGKSDSPSHGYRVARLAKDLAELMHHLGDNTYNLIGHSLGASVVYQYLDLFGSNKINKMVLIDEPSILMHDPSWSAEKIKNLGAIYEPGTLHALLNRFKGKDAQAFKQDIVDSMTTSSASSALKHYLLQCMTLSSDAAKRLYLNNIAQDYRDLLNTIDKPVLYLTGEASLHPWQSHQWMASEVKDSTLEIFTKDEGGSHFLFIENPTKFNEMVTDFLND